MQGTDTLLQDQPITMDKLAILYTCLALLGATRCSYADSHTNHTDSHMKAEDVVERSNITHFFIEKIFEQFGHHGHLDYGNFLAILSELGLNMGWNTTRPGTSEGGHKEDHDEHEEHEGHKHRKRRSAIVPTVRIESTHVPEDLHHKHDNQSLVIPTECLDAEEMLHLHHLKSDKLLGERDFLAICPALIHQLLLKNCNHASEHEIYISKEISSIPASVWLYSTASVFVISLVGLLGVAIIPIMQKVFYNHLLQFLVALAVGALSGDALLHLLPHALEGIMSGGHSDHSDSSHSIAGVWIGLASLCSIFFFFIMERILTIVTRMKNRRKKQNAPDMTEENEAKCLSENIRMDELCHDCEKVITMMIHPNKELVEFAETTLEVTHGNRPHHASHDGDAAKLNETGHSHGFEGVPSSVSSVAWMVILGDGIHNFSDGLAIGAGFANSITVGVSTSIAVFCHELPHEIGDFAVLLRAGMKTKQAVIYNCLSSLLCFVGMLIGVAIGNISTASLWIFAVVAGMFLYIALVDMLPEMTSVNTKQGENQFCHLLLQCLGMVCGSGIMLIIAYYEHDIKNLDLS